MAKISMDLIKQLRNMTGLGMMDCKKALLETDGDIERAILLLRKKGLATAEKRAGKATSEGRIETYIHPGNKLGVMVEIDCETDFVAATDDLKKFAQDICMQIAATKPISISSEQLDPKYLEREKDIIKEQLKNSGKPANMLDKIVEGKLSKIYSEVCLLNQPYIKNDKLTVQDVLNDLIAKLGEKIIIQRFSRFQVGIEGEDYFTI